MDAFAPADLGAQHQMASEATQNIPSEQDNFAATNDVEGKPARKMDSDEVLRRNRVNAPTTKDAPPAPSKAPTAVIGRKRVELNPDAPVSTVDVMDALTDSIQKIGDPANQGAMRTGRMGPAGKQFLGWFSPATMIIRIRTAADLNTAAHEAGHAVDNALWNRDHWRTSSPFGKQAIHELVPLGQAIYKNKPHNGWESEGFAEWFRLFTLDPDQAASVAPVFTKEFQQLINTKELKKFRRAMEQTQLLGATFFQQGSKARVQSHIAPTPSAANRITKEAQQQARDFQKNWTDSAIELQRFVDQANKVRSSKGMPPVSRAADPFLTLTARRLTADAKVDYMANKAMINYAGAHVGEPLSDIFSAVEGKVDDFIIYLYAKRAIALWQDERGPRNAGIDVVDAQNMINELESPQFSIAAQRLYQWNNSLLDYMGQASADYASAVEKIRKQDPGFYIPLQREFGEMAESLTRMGGGGIPGKDLVKRLKGSGRRIKDPVESILANAKQMLIKADQKRILDQVIRLAHPDPEAGGTPGLGHLVVEIPRNKVANEVRIAEAMAKIQNSLNKAMGFMGEEALDLESVVTPLIGDEMIAFFAPAIMPTSQNENPIIPIFHQGKMKWFEVSNGLYEAFNGMDQQAMGTVAQLFFGFPAKAFRLGTTGLNAGFSLVTNPLRDFRTLMLNSQASANPGQLFTSWLSQVKDLFLHTITRGKYTTEWINMFEALGVKMAQPLNQDGLSLKRSAARVKRGGKISWKPFDIPGNVLDFIKDGLQFTEAAARLVEMKAVAKDIGYDGTQPINAEQAATLAAAGKRVTTDFTRSGKIARQINQAVPFFNASIQGPAAHIKALKADPKKFALRGLQGTALVLANWYRIKDEEWWEEMPMEEKYLFTYVPVGDELIRIPRAFEADGLFMAGAEAMADAWYQKEPEQAAEWFGQWLGTLGPVDFAGGLSGAAMSITPVLPKLGGEILANKNFFFDVPIVPRSQEDLDLEEQFSPWTTRVSIELGQVFNQSPRMIDHAIRSIGGGTALDVVALFGRGDPDSPEQLVDQDWQPANTFAFGRMFQREGQQARNPKSVTALYEQYSAALKLQKSKRKEETEEQRDKRLLLTDGVRALKAVGQVANQTKDRKTRQKLESIMIGIAKDATNETKSREAIQEIKDQFTPEEE